MTKEDLHLLDHEPARFARLLTCRLGEKFNEWDQLGVMAWTKKLKLYLSDQANLDGDDLEGGKKSLEQIATDREAKVSEFLLDVIWWRREKSDGEWVALALESEWAYAPPQMGIKRDTSYVMSKVEEDFWKLTVIRSPLKVMLFTSAVEGGETLEKMRDQVCSRLECILERARGDDGETYLVIDTGIAQNRAAWLCSLGSGEERVAKLIRHDWL